jgi:DNA-binding response OmpR family regulator
VNREEQQNTRPRILAIEVEAHVRHFLTKELDGFHFILASPPDAVKNIQNRHIDLVLLDAEVITKQRSEILAEANTAKVLVVMIGEPSDELADGHPVAPMPASPDDLVALLRRQIAER